VTTKAILISTDESVAALGVRILSACLKEQGIQTRIVLMTTDMPDYDGFHWEDLKKICEGASLIGISCMTHSVEKAVEVKRFLERQLNALIVIGGIHATLDPQSLMEEFDLVCHGEGEDVIVALAQRIKQNESYHDIPGLWVKMPNGIKKNTSVPLKRDLNEYPFPDYDFRRQHILRAYHLIPMEPTRVNIMSDGFVVLGSRGCPHNCTYCCNKALKDQFPWMKKVRQYSVDYLINHLKEANRVFPGIKRFWIEDDTFFCKRLEDIIVFSQRYKEEINKPFYVLISPWTFTEQKLEALINAGLNAIIMGIQSGSENVNHHIYDRKLSNAKILQITKVLNKYADMMPHYDFIGMNPFETDKDLQETVRLIRAIPPPFFLFINNLAFYPETELYKRAIKEKRAIHGRSQHSDPLIGYNILFHEKMPHKIFHFLILQLAGKVNAVRIGGVPRVLLTDKFIAFYSFINSKTPWLANLVISIMAGMVLLLKGLKKNLLKVLKKLLGANHYLRLKQILEKATQ
jgi:radical SAM superfamily enzyme YgiQ (UPF0313 family)